MLNVKFIYDTNFDAPDVHCDKENVSSLMLKPKIGNPKCYDYKDPEKIQTDCREIDPYLLKDPSKHTTLILGLDVDSMSIQRSFNIVCLLG
jgi:hypothetical protein